MTVNKDMTVGEILSKDRNCAPVFMQHGLFCLGCPHATAESVEQAAAAHGIELDPLMKDLNEFFAEK